MSETNKVRLNPAFFFTCESCGRDTFIRSVPVEDPEISEQVANAFKEILYDEGDERRDVDWDGDLSQVPDKVTCDHCNLTFEVDAEEYDMDDFLSMFGDTDPLDDDEWLEDDEDFDEWDEDEQDDEDEWIDPEEDLDDDYLDTR